MEGMRWVQSRPERVSIWTFGAGFAGLDAVAVEFEFVEPAGAVRGRISDCWASWGLRKGGLGLLWVVWQ